MDFLGAASAIVSLAKDLVSVVEKSRETIKSIRNAEENWKDITEIDIISRIEFIVNEVRYLTADTDLGMPQEIGTLKRMREELESSSRAFRDDASNAEPTGRRQCVMFGIRTEKELREKLVGLETSAQNLVRWLRDKDVLDRLKESAKVRELAGHVFVPKQGMPEISVTGADHCRVVEAGYQPVSSQPAMVVRVLAEEIGHREDGMAILTRLLRKSDHNPSADITLNQTRLQCLGFVAGRLMFRLPEHADDPRTLRTRMLEENGSNKPKIALSERFAIARQLVDAVVKLHATGVMHENLRSDTVLSVRLKPASGDGSAAATADPPPAPAPEAARSSSARGGARGLWRRMSSGSLRAQRRGNKDDDGNARNDSGTEEQRGRRRSDSLGRPSSRIIRRSSRKGERKEERVEAKPAARSPFAVVLTRWSQAQDCGAIPASSIPPEDDWHLKVYRHPQQQVKQEGQPASQADDCYNFGHDIYALGVCLLEIGLWRPLVQLAHDGTAVTAICTPLLKSAGADAVTDWLGCELAEALRAEGSRKVEKAVATALGKDAILNAPKLLRDSVVRSHIGGDDGARGMVASILGTNLKEAFREDPNRDGFSRRFIKRAVVKVFRGFTFGTNGDVEVILENLDRLKAAIDSVIKTAVDDFAKAAFSKWENSSQGNGITTEVYETARDRMRNCLHQTGVVWSPRAEEMVHLVQSLINSIEETSASLGGGMVTAETVLDAVMTGRNRENGENGVVGARQAEINNLLKEPRGGAALTRALVTLAERDLPGDMDYAYRDIVVRCLQCLDDGVGFILKHKGVLGRVGRKEACDDMEEKVVKPLAAAWPCLAS
ncbi:uncharacterized protein B0H64DRAFT_385743 [Chaetomium fimeti]|uniref:Protein kinase domain-containing protein n=1 Tax=Chaetomium fimeti TaxID=1854472 RepID=A0AAE0HLW8_9PEZI|nr:hypothetical protein B0H64DRAFT_385743 [Chaetomium fimeti]